MRLQCWYCIRAWGSMKMMKTAPEARKIQTRLTRGGYPMRSCADEILLERKGQHQRRLNSGGCLSFILNKYISQTEGVLRP